MAFQIKKLDNKHVVYGQLRSNQVFQVLNYFKAVMISSNELSISLNDSIFLDLGTKRLFEELVTEATRKTVSLKISQGSKLLYSNSIIFQEKLQLLNAA